MFSMDFFRRNLKPIMAALTLMAMITFVFDDAMRAGATFLIPMIFAFLFGGAGFVWGARRGKQTEDLVVGAILGLALGFFINSFGSRDTGSEPGVAGLSPREIVTLKSRRQSANQIVAALFRKSHPLPADLPKDQPFMVQFFEMRREQELQNILFNYGRQDLEQDVVFGQLLRQEAHRLGITVSDEAVTEFIRVITNGKIGPEEYREVREELRVNDHYIFEVLRDELAARMAARMTVPHITTTPAQRWQDFRKVTVKHEIEAATIPVEPFVAKVGEPSDSDLKSFFHQHKEKYPSFKGEPGFRQPDKARLAYLKADYEAIEGTVKDPTDEEIAKHYETNKEFYIDRTPAKKEEPKDEPKEGEAKDGDTPNKPDSEKPAEPKEGDKPKSEDKPKADGDKPADEKKPVDEKKPEEKKPDGTKSDPQGAAGEDKVAADSATQDKTDKPADATDEPKKPDAEKADEKKADDKKSDEEKKTGEEKKETSEKKSDETPLEFTDKKEERPEPKYKPLEEVKDQILEQLKRGRTLDEMRKRTEKAVAEMRRLGAFRIGEKNDTKDKLFRTPQEVADVLKGKAKEIGLGYIETTLLTPLELRDSDTYDIGKATDPTDEGMRQQGAASVVDRVFGRGNDSKYTPELAEDEAGNRFVFWVIERVAAHVPTFEEPGVKEQVAKAWKLKEARPKAESRAKDLAKRAAESKQALSEVLAGQTLLGDTESANLTVIQPPEFSHFSLQGASTPQVNPLNLSQQQAQLTQVPGLEKADHEVLTAIDKMSVGATEVIANEDQSVLFVVHLKGRTDISADDDAPQRQDFIERWPFGVAANQLANEVVNPVRKEWAEGIERRYGVVWPVK